MSRRLADPLYDRLRSAFPPDQAYTRADWEGEAAMPGPVAHFLEHLLRHHSRREARRLRRARTDWVNYDHPEVEKAVRTFFDAVAAHAQVPADDWADTLRTAVDRTTAHLVRPRAVLPDFVFGDRAEPLPLLQVEWRMRFFAPHAYLREAVHAYGEQRDIDTLDRDRFEAFLARIDNRLTADFDADRWLRLLEPLFATARHALGHERVPVPLLRRFFEEKERTEVIRRLDRYAQDHDEIGPPALRRVLTERTASDPAPDSSDTPPTTEPPPEPARPDEPEAASDEDLWGVAGGARPEGDPAAAPAPTGGEGTPLWKQFQQGRSAGPSGGDGGENEPLWARFRKGQPPRASQGGGGEDAPDPAGAGSNRGAPRSPDDGTPSGTGEPDLPALEREILGTSNPSHRGVYVQQLFGGDKQAYQQVLQRLRTADSWGEASDLIASDVFRKHKVNIYSDAAVHFTNAVEQRFRE